MMGIDTHLTIQLHDGLCAWNHTGGCSLHYESKNGIVEDAVQLV